MIQLFKAPAKRLVIGRVGPPFKTDCKGAVQFPTILKSSEIFPEPAANSIPFNRIAGRRWHHKHGSVSLAAVRNLPIPVDCQEAGTAFFPFGYKGQDCFPAFQGVTGQFYLRFLVETVSLFLPLARRRASTLRPSAVDILFRNPWSFNFFRFDG